MIISGVSVGYILQIKAGYVDETLFAIHLEIKVNSYQR
jgi:hypothetical protein